MHFSIYSQGRSEKMFPTEYQNQTVLGQPGLSRYVLLKYIVHYNQFVLVLNIAEILLTER
jgi:hypothetical protein